MKSQTTSPPDTSVILLIISKHLRCTQLTLVEMGTLYFPDQTKIYPGNSLYVLLLLHGTNCHLVFKCYTSKLSFNKAITQFYTRITVTYFVTDCVENLRLFCHKYAKDVLNLLNVYVVLDEKISTIC